MPKLFISYKHDDKIAVKSIRDRLKENYDVWVDAWSLTCGQVWQVEIHKAIDEAVVVLLILTPDACESPHVKNDIDYAKSVGRRIIPLQIKKVKDTDLKKLGIENLHYIDFVTGYDDRFAWEELLKELP